MSSKENAERLAHLLNSLKFVESLSADFGRTDVQVICRVQRNAESKWAKVVEKILLAAEEVQGQEHYWISHICRLYFLKDGRMVYGWHVSISSNEMDKSLGVIARVLAPERPQMRAAPVPKHLAAQQGPVRGQFNVIEADAKGNPRVPAHHKVEVIPMAGLDPHFDRNAPTEEGRGAFGMYRSQRLGSPFTPPTSKDGKVGG